jgi:hypothetical protein
VGIILVVIVGCRGEAVNNGSAHRVGISLIVIVGRRERL